MTSELTDAAIGGILVLLAQKPDAVVTVCGAGSPKKKNCLAIRDQNALVNQRQSGYLATEQLRLRFTCVPMTCVQVKIFLLLYDAIR